MDDIKGYFEQYKLWVKTNPMGASRLESAVRLGSYVIAGRFKNSTVIWEIVYSGSKLLEMLNDRIIEGKLFSLSTCQVDKMKFMLNVLEYAEVLLEVCANQIWGPTGKWAVISIIQAVKLIWKGFLLVHCKVKMLGSPVVDPINRRTVMRKLPKKPASVIPNEADPLQSSHERLERSRRLVRRIGFTPAKHRRTFSPVRIPTQDDENEKPSLELQPYIAEGLHIVRPMVHLGSLYAFGKDSWLPYFMSFAIDATSIDIHSRHPLSKEEHLILLNRYLRMLRYLIRDPLFGKYTQHVLNKFLSGRANGRIPLLNSLCSGLLKYIPEWQKTYAYTWS